MIPLLCRAGGLPMRGCDDQSGSLFSYVDLEKRIRPDHPLRTISSLVDDALASLNRAFTDLYAAFGRPLPRRHSRLAQDLTGRRTLKTQKKKELLKSGRIS